MATRRSIRAAGLNWNSWSRVALGLGILMVVLTQVRATRCTIREFGEVDLPTVEVDAEAGADEAITAVAGDEGFFSRLGSAVSDCRARHPVIAAPLWMLLGCLACFAASIVFTILGRIDYTRQVRAAASKQRKARKSLRRERAVRGQSGGAPTVRSESAAPAAVAPPLNLTGPSSAGAPSSMMDAQEDDVLAALDAQIAAREQASEQAVAAPPGPPTQETPQPGGEELPSLDDLEEIDWDGFDPEPDLPGGEALDSDSAPGPDQTGSGGAWQTDAMGTSHLESAPTLPSGPDLDDLDLGSAEAPAPPVDADPGGIDPMAATIAPTEAATLGAGGGQSGESGTVLGLGFSGPVTFGDEICVRVHAPGFRQEQGSNAELSLSYVDNLGQEHRAWAIARSLATVGRLSVVDSGAEIRIPWQAVHDKILALTRAEGGGVVTLRAGVRSQGASFTAETSLVDGLVIDFRDTNDTPIEHALARVTASDGSARLGWVGAERPGRLSVAGIPPGACHIEFEDASQLMYPGGVPGWRISLASSGPAFGAGGDEAAGTPVHDLVAVRSRVLYVSAGADPATGDGLRGTPFHGIGAALATVQSAREAGEPGFESVEIRVDPTARMPTGRHGLITAGDGTCQWMNWWSALPADTTTEWTVDEGLEPLRGAARGDTQTLLGEDVVITSMNDIRIVNTAFAQVRERIAQDTEFSGSIEAEYANVPMAVIARPESKAVEAFRIKIEHANNVVVEGIHMLGCAGQSGVAVAHSKAVRVRRCWIDLFESGPTGRSGVHAVGRGVQVDASGGGSGPAILFERCDIGWNHAQRRSVPVRAAGIAVYDSNVRLVECYVHHNRSTQAPTDVFGAGQTSIQGTGNHRASNRVAF